jgi:hypothetical protein
MHVERAEHIEPIERIDRVDRIDRSDVSDRSGRGSEPAVPAAPQADRRLDAWLLRAAAFFAVAVVLHNGDHVRRGADAVSTDVFWLGTAGIVLEVAVVLVICQRHRIAPLAAAVAGTNLTAGYVLVHFLPERTWLSDSFTGGADVSPLSWTAALIEVAAAATLAVVGTLALSRRGGLASAARPYPRQRTLREAILHPLALGFALTQVVTIVVSFAQA